MNRDYKERMRSEWHVSHEGVNAILGSCGVSRTTQSFFKSEPVDVDLSCSVLDTLAFDVADVDFRHSLAWCPELPQKRQSLLSIGTVVPVESACRLC